MIQLILNSLWETVYMTIPAVFFSYLVGLPLGIVLFVTQKGGLAERPKLNMLLGSIINLFRSVPFIILVALLFPLTRMVMGKATGTKAFIFPLVVCAAPFIARMVEGSLMEIPAGIGEAAISMGSTNMQVIRVMLRESLPSLINGAAISFVTILSYTAMASVAGGGGLGAAAITKGLNLRKMDVMYLASIILVILVNIISVIGGKLNRSLDHRKK